MNTNANNPINSAKWIERKLINMPVKLRESQEEVLTQQEIIDQEFEVIAYAFNVQNSLP